MLFGMLTTDSSWVRRGDSEEEPTAGGLFAHADQVLAPYGSHDTPPGSSDPVTLEFRPHYAKGLYLSGASAPHCTAQPVSSWSGSRLMHWLSFQVRCESCVVSTAVLVTAVPAVLASLAQADSSGKGLTIAVLGFGRASQRQSERLLPPARWTEPHFCC
jgi:hypothetical protein